MIYKDRLKELREYKNITQKEIASFLNISSSCYERYENEHDIFPIKQLIKTCNYLNVSLDYLFNLIDKNYNKFTKIEDYQIIGIRLTEFRKENKITQQKLASILNTNKSVICNYEKGRNIIATPFLYEICKKYNISADYLLGRTNSPKYLK